MAGVELFARGFDAVLAAERARQNRVIAATGVVILAVAVSAGFVGLFDTARLAEGVPALFSLAGEMLPPTFTEPRKWAGAMVDTLAMSIAGTAIAVLLALPLGFLAAANTTPHPAVLYVTRGILNLTRTVPELVLGIVFVAAVGFGPLPGVLALGLHSAGMVGKFFAESIEHASNAPIEAARATGASRFQVIWHGVLPQVLPQFADVSIYRWEYNFRASTVMGMVGAGGIGFELMGSLRIMQYQEVSAILLLILAMVSVVDALGQRIRRGMK